MTLRGGEFDCWAKKREEMTLLHGRLTISQDLRARRRHFEIALRCGRSWEMVSLACNNVIFSLFFFVHFCGPGEKFDQKLMDSAPIFRGTPAPS